MKSKKVTSVQIYSYLALRKSVGWIGILLPFVLMFGVFLLFDGDLPLITISQYYYSGMRDVFVGAICAIALFMFFYRGYDKWDDLLGNIAGFSALCIALFPTTEDGSSGLSRTVHFVAAGVFFITLAVFSIFLFTREASKPTSQKIKRNRIYRICGYIMIACLAAIVVYYNFFKEKHLKSTFVFWAETTALVAFGVSWLTKGGVIHPDR